MLFACEDSGSSSGSFPDATAFEAGGEETSVPDAFVPADAADAADTSVAQSVIVHVLSGGAPEANVLVVFHDAKGDVLETKMTQADGKAASTPGMSPAMASALLGGGAMRRILTWSSVSPGDELFADNVGPPASSGSYAVTLQGSLVDSGQTSANADIGVCTASTADTSVLVPLMPECLRPSTTILARAFGASAGPPVVVGYAFAKGAPAAALDGGTTSAAVGPWVFPTNVTVTPMNLPAQASSFAGFVDISGTLPFDNTTGGAISAVNGKASFQVAPGFADAYQGAIRVLPDATPGARLTIAKRVAPATNIDIDFAAALPALNTGALVLSTIKRPEVFWSTAGNASLMATDGGTIALHWTDTGEEDNGWTFIVAPGTKNVKAPAMPQAADAWLPRAAVDGGAAASSFNAPEVTFIEADVLPGYAEFRAQVGRIIPQATSTGRDARAVLPKNGTLRATTYMDLPL